MKQVLWLVFNENKRLRLFFETPTNDSNATPLRCINHLQPTEIAFTKSENNTILRKGFFR